MTRRKRDIPASLDIPHIPYTQKDPWWEIQGSSIIKPITMIQYYSLPTFNWPFHTDFQLAPSQYCNQPSGRKVKKPLEKNRNKKVGDLLTCLMRSNSLRADTYRKCLALPIIV